MGTNVFQLETFDGTDNAVGESTLFVYRQRRRTQIDVEFDAAVSAGFGIRGGEAAWRTTRQVLRQVLSNSWKKHGSNRQCPMRRVIDIPVFLDVGDVMASMKCTRTTAYAHVRRAVGRMPGARGQLCVPVYVWDRYARARTSTLRRRGSWGPIPAPLPKSARQSNPFRSPARVPSRDPGPPTRGSAGSRCARARSMPKRDVSLVRLSLESDIAKSPCPAGPAEHGIRVLREVVRCGCSSGVERGSQRSTKRRARTALDASHGSQGSRDRCAADGARWRRPCVCRVARRNTQRSASTVAQNPQRRSMRGPTKPRDVAFCRTKCGHLTPVFEHDEHDTFSALRLATHKARHVDDYISVRRNEGAAENTIAKELVALRAALTLARRAGLWRGDPAAVCPIAFAPEYKPRTRFLSPSDLQRLLA
jgi:hypothetical protein